MDAFGAGKIEERLVDRQRFDQRRQRLHGVAHLAADADIFRHVGRDDGGLRAELQRLEHRHRRAHAIGARDIAGGRHHAALAAADNHGPVGKLGIVALLDRGVERVAIDMRERQRRAGHDGGRRAVNRMRRTVWLDIEVAEAIPAERARTIRACAGALTARRAPSPGRQDLAGGGDIGRRQLRGVGKRLHGRIVAHHEVEHGRRNCGSAAAVRSVSGPMPLSARKRPKSFGIAGNEAQRLNCNDFSHFAGVVNRLFHRWVCLSVNLWCLVWNHHARVCGMGSSKWKPHRKSWRIDLTA